MGADAKEACEGRCGAEQCALCRGDADTDNKQNIVSNKLILLLIMSLVLSDQVW